MDNIKKYSVENYKTRFSVVMTKKDGEKLPKILSKHNCDNLSQLIKRIIHNQLVLIDKKEYINLKTRDNISQEEIDRFEKDFKKEIILKAFNYDSFDELVKDFQQ